MSKVNIKKRDINVDSREAMANTYIYAILCVFPLLLIDGYFDLTKAKFFIYFWVTISFATVMLVYSLATGVFSSDVKKLKFDFLDISFLFYTLLNVVSFIAPTYKRIVDLGELPTSHIFTGIGEIMVAEESRFTGLLLRLLIFITYIILTKYAPFKDGCKKYIRYFLVTAVAVALLGIFDYFDLDVLSLKENIQPGQRHVFVSTLGNINLFTAFVGIFLTIASILFCKLEDLKQSVILYVFVFIGFFAIIVGRSDNAYIFVGSLFLFSPLYLFDNMKSIIKYFALVATFFVTAEIIDIVNVVFAEKVWGINDGVFAFLVDTRLGNFLTILSILLLLISFFIYKKTKFDISKYSKTFKILWSGAICVTALAAFGLFFYFNINVSDNAEFPSFANYFILTDEWGSGRGYIWKNSMKLFADSSFTEKLIGAGPANFTYVFNSVYYRESVERYNVYFDNPHNEYINILITSGILGLISSMIFLFGALIRIMKSIKNNIINAAIFFMLLGYHLNMVVNLDVPIISPVMYVLFFIALANSKNEQTPQEEVK